MIYKIALVLKPYILKYCKEKLSEIPSEIRLDYFSYTAEEEFESVCKDVCRTYDGIITSGCLPDNVLEHKNYVKNIFRGYFYFDVENTYRLILSELLLQPDLKISDIGVDFLYGIDENLNDIILNNKITQALEHLNTNLCRINSYDTMEKWETQLAEYYIKLLEKNEIRFVLTCSLTVAKILTDKGYHCKYILPSFSTMEQVIKTICHKVDMRNMKGILPAIIRIDLHPSKDIADSYYLIQYNTELKKKLTEFVQLEGNNLNLRCSTNNFEIYSDLDTIQNLTQNYNSCYLRKYIGMPLLEMISIGYGVGGTFYEAHIHATTASEYAFQFKAESQKSFLIDEKEQLISLQSNTEISKGENLQISNEKLKKLSLEAKLSVNTLIKILNVLNTEKTSEISSVELINHLGVSLRTANHYLSNLEKCQKASVVARKRPNGRGRSINIYRLDFS